MIELYDKEFKKKVSLVMMRHQQDPFFDINEVDSLLEESAMYPGMRSSVMKSQRNSSVEHRISGNMGQESEMNDWVVQNKLKHRG